jgi:aminotransferase in exopolysaccharide biosynthesis
VTAIAENFVSVVRQVVSGGRATLHEPVFGGNEKKYLLECIDSGYVSSVGEFVTRFEKDLATYVGAEYAVAVSNGTVGLQLALVACGVKPGQEVLVPALSFVATANAVSHTGAIAHFVDVDPETWGLDPVAFRSHLQSIGRLDSGRLLNKNTGREIVAVVPMHTLGHPVDMAGILEVSAEFDLMVVEDAAESLGSFIGDVHTGLFGNVGMLSFNGNKTMTTGGGGALVTNDENLARKLKHLSTTARVPHRWSFDHDDIGFNFRMPNVNAALGVAQLEQLPGFVTKQRALFSRYQHVFSHVDFGVVKEERQGTTSNYWLQALLLEPHHASDRDVILDSAHDAGIALRPLWNPLNELSPYLAHPSAPTPVTRGLCARAICLPSSVSLMDVAFS